MLHSSCMLLRSNVKNVMLVIRINRSSYIFCGSVVEHRSAEPEGLRFDSVLMEIQTFFFCCTLETKGKKTSLINLLPLSKELRFKNCAFTTYFFSHLTESSTKLQFPSCLGNLKSLTDYLFLQSGI